MKSSKKILNKSKSKTPLETEYGPQSMMMLRYSKPRLPPRLNWKNFNSFTTTPTTPISNKIFSNRKHLLLNSSNDANLTRFVSNSLEYTRQKQAKLSTSLNQTLYHVTLSLYENEHVQMILKRLFDITNEKSVASFGWRIILNKLQAIALMCVDVLVIGLRYYPLMGVMERRTSCLCMAMACFYMWMDIVYNVTLTGLCEGI